MDSKPRSFLDFSATVMPSPGVLVQELDGEAVLLTHDSERYFKLDSVATRVWQHLLVHRRLGRICAEMLKEYDVDEFEVRADVVRLVEELMEAGIVTLGSDTAVDAGDS
jgi:hypothetical protein